MASHGLTLEEHTKLRTRYGLSATLNYQAGTRISIDYDEYKAAEGVANAAKRTFKELNSSQSWVGKEKDASRHEMVTNLATDAITTTKEQARLS
ncbi:hypothetical protein HJFPF1_05181 [Paramyrothecium foliicola]|nr:hypothetical protein HJFPF1_05181 [Paramyrothecium foliicola]